MTDMMSEPNLVECLRKFGKLRQAKALLEQQLRDVNSAMEALEGYAIEAMAIQGVKSIGVDDTNYFFQKEFFCRGKEGVGREEIVAAFIESGTSDLLMPSYQSLRAIVREKAESGEEIDPRIAAVMDIGDQIRLRARKN